MLTNPYIEKDPNVIMNALVNVLAAIMNVIMNGVWWMTQNMDWKHSLGLTIIFTTLVIRVLMLPQGIQAMKSSQKMRLVQPEVAKIKKKYGNSKDPEIMRKVNAETQEVYRKNKINPLGGCLPLLITMPIFIAFIDLMRRLPLYLHKVKDVYIAIHDKLNEIPEIFESGSDIWNIAVTKAPVDVIRAFFDRHGRNIDIRIAEDFIRFIDKFTDAEWELIKAGVTDPRVLTELEMLLQQRENIQTFVGLNLVNVAGLGWPGIMIPILSGGTSFLLSYITTKMQPMTDQSAKMNQMIMMVAMPVMMFVFTINISGGVGVYWIAGNLIAIAQTALLTKFVMKRKNADGAEIIGTAREKK